MTTIRFSAQDYQEVWEAAWATYLAQPHEQYSPHQLSARAFVHAVIDKFHQRGIVIAVADERPLVHDYVEVD